MVTRQTRGGLLGVVIAVLLALCVIGASPAIAQDEAPADDPAAQTQDDAGADDETGGTGDGLANALADGATDLGCEAVGTFITGTEPLCDTVTGAAESATGIDDNEGIVEESTDRAAEGAFGKIVESAQDSMVKAFVLAITFWVKLPTDAFNSQELIGKITSHTKELMWFALTASIIASAVRLVRERMSGNGSEEIFELHVRVVIANSMLAAFFATGAEAGDRLSDWLLRESAGEDGPAAVETLINAGALNKEAGILVLIIALFGILGAFAQLMFMVVRSVLLLFSSSALPIAAAASGMQAGSTAYARLLQWSIAFLLYKPIGAFMYAVAFWAGNDAEDTNQVILSIIALVLVAVLLPALIKLCGGPAAAMSGAMSGLAVAGAIGGIAGGGGGSPGPSGGGGSPSSGGGGGGTAGGTGGSPSPSGFSQQGNAAPTHTGGSPQGQSGGDQAQIPAGALGTAAGSGGGRGGQSGGGDAGGAAAASGGPSGTAGAGAAGKAGGGAAGGGVGAAVSVAGQTVQAGGTAAEGVVNRAAELDTQQAYAGEIAK